MGERVQLYGGDLAPLSIGILVSVCAYPKEHARRVKAMHAFCALLERHNIHVSDGHRPLTNGRAARRWKVMSDAAMTDALDGVAYRLLTRRFAAIQVGFLRGYRPAGVTVEAVHVAFHESTLRPGNDALGTYRRNAAHDECSNAEARDRQIASTVGRDVVSESRPVLHLAYVIRSELERANLSVWDWPLLAATLDGAAPEGPDLRLARMVEAARYWQQALCCPAQNGARVVAAGVKSSEQISVSL
jgi:hypothetical protein